MKKVTVPVVKRLVASRAVPSISIYINADPVRPGSLDDRLRLRAHLRRVSELLEPALARPGADALLTSIAERAREAWPEARSVAFLRSPDSNEAFALPVTVPELAIVSSTFHTKPLVSLLDAGVTFAVLGIGDGVARLHAGTRDGLERVDGLIPAAPASALDRLPWYRAIDRIAARFLEDTQDPLVLAGEHHHLEPFRTVSRYPRLLSRAIECDLAQVQVGDLLLPAMAIVDEDRAEAEAEAAVQYLAAAAVGHATEELGAVGRAAVLGRVPLLVHRRGAHVWGSLDRLLGRVTVRAGEPGPADADVIDDLCELVLQQGGDVVELPRERMPCRGPVGAIVRKAIAVPVRRAWRPERAASP
jgi:hypothetical protein